MRPRVSQFTPFFQASVPRMLFFKTFGWFRAVMLPALSPTRFFGNQPLMYSHSTSMNGVLTACAASGSSCQAVPLLPDFCPFFIEQRFVSSSRQQLGFLSSAVVGETVAVLHHALTLRPADV